MAELSFEELLKGLMGGDAPKAGARLTPDQYAELEKRAATRAADLAKNRVDRSAGVRAAEEYLAGKGGKKAASGAVRKAGGSLAKRAIAGGGAVGAGLLLNEILQGGLQMGVNLYAPERPSFIPPEVHSQIMERLGTVDPGRDSFLLRNRTGEPDVPVGPLAPGQIRFPVQRGTIPSSQPESPARGARRRPVDLNAIDNPEIPVERGTGVIRNEQTGRVFGIDARDTVNRQFEDVPLGRRIQLPSTGFSDIDAAMPGIVMAAQRANQADRQRAAETAIMKERADLLKALAVEQMKQQAPNIKVLEPGMPGQPPQVVMTNPATGKSTVQAALPPGQDLATLDASQKALAARRPDILKQINEQRKTYGLPSLTE